MLIDTKEEEIRRLAYTLWEKAGSPDGAAVQFWDEAKKQLSDRSSDQELNEGLEETFPASDPPANLLRS